MESTCDRMEQVSTIPRPQATSHRRHFAGHCVGAHLRVVRATPQILQTREPDRWEREGVMGPAAGHAGGDEGDHLLRATRATIIPWNGRGAPRRGRSRGR